MAIRLSGLNSGLDTEAIVSAMVSGYKAKKDNLVKKQTKLGWKQEAWKSVNTKVYGLYKDINSLRFSSAYSLKKTTVSDSTKASVTASGSAINGSQELGVAQLAKAGYLTGGQFSSGTTGSTKLSSLAGYGGAGTVSVNGKDVSVDDNTTIDQFVSKLNEAGVKASYDSGNRRIFVSAKDSGVANDFTLTGADANGNKALLALGLYQGVTEGSATYNAAKGLADYAGKSDTDLKAILSGLNDAHEVLSEATFSKATNEKNKSYAEAYKLVQDYENGDKGDTFKKLGALLDAGSSKAAYVKVGENGVADEYYSRVEEVDNDDGTKTYKYYKEGEEAPSYTAPDDGAKLESYKERLDVLAETSGLVGSTNGDYAKFTAARATIKSFEEDSNNAEEVDKVHEAYAVAHENGDFSPFKAVLDGYSTAIVDADNSIAVANATIAADQALDPYYSYYNKDEKIDELQDRISAAKAIVDGALNTAGTASETATRVNGQDSIIYLNGAKFTSATNKHSINGLTINATGVTGTEDEIKSGKGNVTITTGTDTDGIYDKVKEFLTKYNEVVNSLSSLYNADSSKGYEPLTDEEKAELSDTQAEKWEQKIKDSLLRRDQTLSSIMNVMNNAMSKSYDIGGKKYSLSTFGINTLGYFNSDVNEKYAYHIDGDEDDSSTSAKTDKLRAAIEDDPEAVTDFLKQLTDGLYKSLDKQMKSTSMKSAYTVYNDKSMDKEYKSYTEQIKTWETRVSAMEESYFKKFTAMEKALTTMQSNSSSLTGMLGG